MSDFVALKLSRDEYQFLVRLLGHHVVGGGVDKLYNRLFDLRPRAASYAENMGPINNRTPVVAADNYGERPMVSFWKDEV